MINAALVLEGGALRTLYTAGVLDVFMERGLDFAYVIGTSAGSTTGINYVSGQNGRTAHMNINYCGDKNYISMRNRVRHGSVFNLDFFYEEPRGRWDSFDDEAYLRSEKRYIVTATSCLTGEPVYFENPGADDIRACLRASCSMPLFSRIVQTTNGPCLDGGVTDSIPFGRALKDGFDKLVVIKTRDSSYRKKASSLPVSLLYKLAFFKYPAFLRALLSRPQAYNRQLDELSALEARGKAFVIEPGSPVAVSRTEQDKEKLRALYRLGRNDAENALPALEKFLGNLPIQSI